MLSEQERRIVSYCEQRWFLDGVLPTPETLCETFGLTPKRLQSILEALKPSFEERGMPVVEGRSLTPQQVTAANTMLNTADGRSYRKRLSDLGISPTKWDGWLQNPDFHEYLASRSRKILDNALPDAHLALVENVKHGDLSSLKFYYEMTGYYTGKESQIDVRMVLNKVLEIIMTHVTDPEVLKSISREIGLLVGLDSPATIESKPVVKGEIL